MKRLLSRILSIILVTQPLLAEVGDAHLPSMANAPLVASNFQIQALSLQTPWGNAMTHPFRVVLKNVRRGGIQFRKQSANFFNHPEYGLALVVLEIVAGVSISRALDVPIPIWKSADVMLEATSMVGRLVMLQGLILSTASIAFVFARSRSMSRSLVRRLRPVWPILLITVALPTTLIFSMNWSLLVRFNSVLGFYITMIAIFTCVFVPYVLPLLRPNFGQVIRRFSRGRMISTAAASVALGFLFAAPHAFIHVWGHAVAYQLLYVSKSVDPGFWSLFEDGRPAVIAHFAPLGLALTVLSEKAGYLTYLAAGSVTEWIYGATLFFLSVVMKKRPILRRGFQLGGLAVGFFSLQYLSGSVFLNGTETDWTKIWVLASPLIKRGMTFIGLSLPFAILMYSGTVERREWLSRVSVHAGMPAFIQPFAQRISAINVVLVRWFWTIPRGMPVGFYVFLAALIPLLISHEKGLYYAVGSIMVTLAMMLFLFEVWLTGMAIPGMSRHRIWNIVLNHNENDRRRTRNALSAQDQKLLATLEDLAGYKTPYTVGNALVNLALWMKTEGVEPISLDSIDGLFPLKNRISKWLEMESSPFSSQTTLSLQRIFSDFAPFHDSIRIATLTHKAA